VRLYNVSSCDLKADRSTGQQVNEDQPHGLARGAQRGRF